MALAVAAAVSRRTLRDKELVLTLTPTGNYTTGGDTVDLTNIANPKFKTDATIGFPGVIEQYEVINSPGGYNGVLVPGATLATWKLKVEQGGAAVSNPSAEIPQAAYPAAVLAGVFQIRLVGPKLRF